MRKQKLRQIAAMLLAVCLLIGCIPAATAAGTQEKLQLQQVSADISPLLEGNEAELTTDTPAADEVLRVIILFRDAPLTEKGFSTSGLSGNAAAMAYRDKLEKSQTAQLAAVSRTLGQSLEIRYQFTLGINGVATSVRYDQIAKIEAMANVESVYIENRYQPDVVEPNTSTSGTMIGSYSAWAKGYTGAGSRIAVIDTGLDTDHPSFEESCFLYGLERSAARFGKEISDYNLLTQAEVADVLPKLHVAGSLPGVTADELYLSAKVPFAFNYIDEDLDVTHDNDSASDHGTHVSGIATANTYVWGKDSDGDLRAVRQENGVVGVAPDAQLLAMKVFGKGGGAYDSDYMAALEDAILLGCDTVNLSLGSSNSGHTYSSKSSFDDLFASLQNTDTVVTISAGNNSSYALHNNTGTGMQLTGDTVLDTVGSPGAYANAFTIASVDNAGLTGVMPVFNGVGTSYSDTSATYGAREFATLDLSADRTGTDYEYVFLGDPVAKQGIFGVEEDFAGLDLTGKVVLISRGGGVNFAAKANNAAAAGAVAVVVYNNESSNNMNMNLTGYNYKYPAILIPMRSAESILDASEQDDASGLWGGKLTIANQVRTVQDVPGGFVPSDFSAWGVPGNLELKPEITAPGGNIWSTLTDGTYGIMSGTSMSAPSVTGMAAVVAQYLKETGLAGQEGLTVRALSQALLMSTSHPLKQENEVEYSPRKQGSGFADVYKAVTTPAYLLTDEKQSTDGKVKVSLGDDPQRTGEYQFDFTIQNMSDKALEYVLHGAVNTMDVELVDGDKYMSNNARALSPEIGFETEAESRLVYDVNGDGKVDEEDARYLLKVANGTEPAMDEDAAARYDFDGDGAITTTDAQRYLAGLKNLTGGADVYAKAVSVEAGSSVKVRVSVKLSQEDRTYFAENYQNGGYVEGFVYATDPTGRNAELSLPVLAYYGSWTEPSMFDKYVTLEDSWDESAYPYTGTGYTNYLLMRAAGSSSAYYLTANPYAAATQFLEDRTAVSSTSGVTLYAAAASLIRNAGGDLNVVISNAETGEVYKTYHNGAAYAAFYSASAGAWGNTAVPVTLNWRFTDGNGNPLAEGTKIKVSVNAIPEYNWNRKTGETKGTLGDGASWVTTMTVDNTAPVVTDASFTRNLVNGQASLKVTAQDNRYVAAVLVTNARQTEILARAGFDQTVSGAEATAELDLSGVTASEVCLLAVDYAGNMTAYKLSLGGGQDQEIESGSFYAHNSYDGSWIAFKPGKMSAAKTVASGSIYAAEYIDGYVFSIDAQKRFCVAPLDNLEEQTYIETLALPSNALDMAYNYADQKLYVLCSENRLYSVDPLMGTLTMEGVIPLSAGLRLMTLACSTEGTFYSATVSDYNSRLYSFTITEDGFKLTPAPKTTGMALSFIQSMAYDHNTGVLYHANYGAKNYYTTLVTYDLDTGEATVVDELYMAELCGMFIPRRSDSTFGPSKEVQEISLSQKDVTLIKGGKTALEVSAKPWTVVNRECTWSSSDEKIARVENGEITAVSAGTCTITAASVLNPAVTAQCTVTVNEVNATLDAVIWDADSQVWFGRFNTKSLSDYTKLSQEASKQKLMAMTSNGKGDTFAASYEEGENNSLHSSLYTVSKDYSLTKIGTAQVAYTDMTWAPELDGGTLLATYGKYIVVVDTTTGDYSAAWNLATVVGSANLVGITYLDTVNDTVTGVTDRCLMLDGAGGVWQIGFYANDGKLMCTIPEKLANLGYTTGGQAYFSSITTDGVYLYCSMCDGSQTDLVVYDLKTGASAGLGNFGTSVWPVVGLEVARTASPTVTASGMDQKASLPAETAVADSLRLSK